MLIASKRKIRVSQFKYAFLVITFAIFALIPITIQINAILFQNDPHSNNFYNDIFREQLVAADSLNDVSLGNPIIILLFLFLGFLTIVYYIPTLNSLGLAKFKGRKEIGINKHRLPEIRYTIPINNVQIRIKRKLNSFDGLFLRELDFLIILPSDYKGDKRLFDFLACEQIFHISNQIILRKTVDIQNIPLLFVRAQALISPSR
ncbi:MAG: hypothetical protein KAT16_07700 [Candidatus Heimdallarchaeota archaeon]|nr:hypothetical protein [Candidatus Heimdallarchaeota archaeon]